MNHSPGPWHWCEDEKSRNCLHAADGSFVTFDGEANPETAAADRVLLCHAPQMLELIKKQEWCAAGGPTNPPRCPACWGAHPKAAAFGVNPIGHAPACPLDALLKQIEGT